MSRYATRFNKRDANEAEIIKVLADLGIDWLQGPPLDGWVFLGQYIPVEIKVKKGKLTAGQKDFISRSNMRERPYKIWRTPLEAIEAVQEWRLKQRFMDAGTRPRFATFHQTQQP